jgi:hypothetical protein
MSHTTSQKSDNSNITDYYSVAMWTQIHWKCFLPSPILLFGRVWRGGSRGSMLHEDSFDDHFLRESLQEEREWIDKFQNKTHGALNRQDTFDSSKFSFSTEYSSVIATYCWMQKSKSYTVELGYSDLGCSDTLAIASNIEWY